MTRNTRLPLALLGILAVAVAGCSNLNGTQQRALSGGAIGAAGGAAVGALAGGSLWTGALLGGAAGAAIGGLTSPSQVKVGN
ncbi:MAG: hypothetical protein OHK0024_34240 [Thalassobaculales bacterium]